MMELIENQVYLEQEKYTKVIGRSEKLLEMCRKLHYELVWIYVQIQTAAAYEKLGKRITARPILKNALEEAKPDGFVIPFAENYRYLGRLLDSLTGDAAGDFLYKIIEIGRKLEERCKILKGANGYPESFSLLTERELTMIHLIKEHLSNKEIGARLFLSEGTVKQYINQIYSKLQITGDTRTKRQQLMEMLSERQKN